MHMNHASHATLQMWVCTSGVLKNVVILCGTKAIIGGAKMANNRHGNRNFLQSYWTLDELSLYSRQAVCEKTHPNQHRERPHVTSIAAWRQGIASLGQTDAIRNQPCSEDNGYLIDVVSQNSEEPAEVQESN
jgi:hypothetical protein